MTKYAFENLDVIRIFAKVFEHNKTSIRALEKCGYVKETVSKNAVLKNGVIMDDHVYRILKEE